MPTGTATTTEDAPLPAHLDAITAHIADPHDRYAQASAVSRMMARRAASAAASLLEPRFCAGCQTEKTVGDFGVNAARSSGLQTYCRECS